MQHLSQGPIKPPSGYLKWSIWGGGGGGGYERVHDSEHVTYRLLAPAQRPVGAAANYLLVIR
jgi:hypothetical protein